MSNIIVMAFSPRNIVGCLLKKRLTKGGSRVPQDPPRYALDHVENYVFLPILLACSTLRFSTIDYAVFVDKGRAEIKTRNTAASFLPMS